MFPMSLLSTRHYFSKISVGAWYTPRFPQMCFVAWLTPLLVQKYIPYIEANICSILKEWSLDDGNPLLYETAHKCGFMCEQFFKAEHILRCFSNFPSAHSLLTCCLQALWCTSKTCRHFEKSRVKIGLQIVTPLVMLFCMESNYVQKASKHT